MHVLLRPAPERPGAGVRPGLPDAVDPVRANRRAQAARPGPRRAVARPGRELGLFVRGGREDPRRPECVLFADGFTGDLRASHRGAGPGAQPLGLAGFRESDRGLPGHRLRRVCLVRPAETRGCHDGGQGGLEPMNLELNTSVADPQWHELIVWYFFLGGIAAGAYVMAALADLF